MATKSKIRMERSAMRDRIRTLRALERGRLSGRRSRLQQPTPATTRTGAHLPAPTSPPVEMGSSDDVPCSFNINRIDVLSKITELQAKLQLFLAVNTFTMQQGQDTVEVVGTEFEGQHHIFRFVHTHRIDTVAKQLAAAVPKVEVDNWIAVMSSMITNCPIVAAEDWKSDTIVGIFLLKSKLRALLDKLETSTM